MKTIMKKKNRNLICTYKSAMFSTQYASNSSVTVIGGAVMKHLTSFYRYRQQLNLPVERSP